VAEAAGDSSGAGGGSNSPSPSSKSDHESGDEHDHSRVEDPTGDLALYERLPMSSVPHRVVRGWGREEPGPFLGSLEPM